ncbi:hypothetical protein HA402_001173 [Bradysia odoriphaga]|nr:hypothetical protein HA402_001173 [Bradysia odoriphaga]
MDKERFSLLLLEPNEIYFEDFLANLIDEQRTASDEPVRDGHLKMCSKSIIFDPKDKMEPIVKIVYKDCKKLYEWPGKLDSKDSNVLAVECTQYTEILERNVLAPYTFRNERRVFLFSMQYARIETLLQHLSQLHRASSLQPYEQNDMIAMIVFSRHKRYKFDPLWLNDIYEGIIVENTVDEIKPLITNPGRLLLSTKAIYFQPYNNIQPYPVKKISLKSLESLTKRRFLLRHISLEIVWKDSSNDKTDTLYVAFRNETDRNSFYEKTMAQDGVAIAKIKPETMTLKWQNGAISNYEYLLYLNSLADRTFHDLTQYPIFPWIISDYTSNELNLEDEKCYRDLTKPMGALNPERLNRLKERFDEMGDPKFLYGSHYSAPGLVLFYLVRKHPKLMLCLQNGRFDHPDRMFNKMSDVYSNCLNNMSDFKELIPEFYDTSKKGDFLLNDLKINFGTRYDGTPVNHVQLPPWAKDSPEYFVETFRKALESDYVSQNLNHWIDLIFGYKQRGEEAIKANNLFFHLCYEGSVDLDEINDLRARHALEVQISEFGQIPKQLFDKPHVPRTRSPSLKEISDIAECGTTINRFDLSDQVQSHKNIVSCVIVDGSTIISTGKDGLLKCYDMKGKRQTRSVFIGSLPLSCCVKIPETSTIVLGSWDNTIMTYNLDFGRVSNVIPAHDDAVSTLTILPKLGILISGSWDCSVKIWKGFNSSGCVSFRMSDAMVAYLSLEEKVSSVDASLTDDNMLQVAVGTFLR